MRVRMDTPTKYENLKLFLGVISVAVWIGVAFNGFEFARESVVNVNQFVREVVKGDISPWIWMEDYPLRDVEISPQYAQLDTLEWTDPETTDQDSLGGWILAGVRSWSIGIDNSDDAFVISHGSELGSNVVFRVESDGIEYGSSSTPITFYNYENGEMRFRK